MGTSDTPRTDRNIGHCLGSGHEDSLCVDGELCRQLERELAAALLQVDNLSKCEICGDDLLTPNPDGSGNNCVCLPCWNKVVGKLAKYEQAKMPEEPAKYQPGEGELEMAGYWWVDADDYDKLRAFAAAETVRADENEADAARYRWLSKTAYRTSDMEPPHWCIPETCGLGSTIHAAIDAALKKEER